MVTFDNSVNRKPVQLLATSSMIEQLRLRVIILTIKTRYNIHVVDLHAPRVEFLIL